MALWPVNVVVERYSLSTMIGVDVESIRQEYANGATRRELAAYYGVSQWTIQNIYQGK